jgi:4-hydroxy-tetrahydrodipicolinate synthase
VPTRVAGKEAKEWASQHLWGNCSSLYTPFSGPDGDDIDFDALRALVRYCLVELDQDGIWLTGGIAEFWSLTTDELKEVVRVAVEEARRVKPAALVQVMSSTDTAKQCVELTLHAQELGVDICYILTPYFECSGKPGVAEYVRYVANRTDMPLGFFTPTPPAWC